MVLHNILRKKSPLRYAPASRFESEDVESGRIILGKWSLDGSDESIHSVNVVGSNTPKIIKKYEKSIVNISTLLAKFHGKKNLFKELTIVDNAGLDLTVS